MESKNPIIETPEASATPARVQVALTVACLTQAAVLSTAVFGSKRSASVARGLLAAEAALLATSFGLGLGAAYAISNSPERLEDTADVREHSSRSSILKAIGRVGSS